MTDTSNPNFYQTGLIETNVTISRAFVEGDNPLHVRAAGDVLPRTCITRMGVNACKECVYYEEYPRDADEAKICSERNLVSLLEEQGLSPDEVLLVSVTGNKVGFYDTLKEEDKTVNHFGNYEQTTGYNAFFARKSEKKALGSRLADCGHVAIEFKDEKGEEVTGFIHMTRTNMQGVGAETFGDGDDNVNYVAYALQQAAEHYGVQVADMNVKLTAAIDKLVYGFSSKEGDPTPEEKMDTAFAGWFDMGLLHNTSNPDWKRGDPIEPTDVWDADYHEMCKHLLLTSGLKPEHVDLTEIINPGNIQSGHASNAAGKHGKRPEARDLYLVIAK